MFVVLFCGVMRELTLCFVVSNSEKHSSCPWKQNIFEDFKEKVGKLQNKLNSEIPQISTTLAPDISEKLKKTGIDPDNFTLQQLFPSTLDDDGNDLPLMYGA
jgi:hypothetical protein